MRKTLTLSLALISTVTMAQTTTAPDPLTQILDKLNSMEKRLDNLEDSDSKQAKPQQAVSTSNSNKTQSVSTTAKNSSNPPKEELTGGMIIKVKHANEKQKKWFTTGISEEHFAGFVATTSKMTTKQIQEKSLGYKGAYALVSEGFLNAKEAGIYNFGLLHEQSVTGNRATNCMASITLNGTELGQLDQEVRKTKDTEKSMLVNGSVSLENGLYEYSTFSVCDDYEKTNYFNKSITRTFLIKAPSDLSMRPIESEDILHKK